MAGWTTADWIIFLTASYIAVIGFLRLLGNRREVIVKQLTADIAKQKKRAKQKA